MKSNKSPNTELPMPAESGAQIEEVKFSYGLPRKLYTNVSRNKLDEWGGN